MQRVLIAGASGLIGQHLLTYLLNDPSVVEVHAIVRRPLGLIHGKLHQHVQAFSALDAPSPDFAADTAFCCLGTTIKVAGSQAAFRAVDQDAVLAFAGLARRAGVRHFLTVSAIGASARSASFYSRVKGEVEASLRGMAFPSLTLARPSLLTGERAELRRGERLGQWLSVPLAPLFAGPLAPYRPIAATVVAKAMAKAGQQASAGEQVLTWRELQALAAD